MTRRKSDIEPNKKRPAIVGLCCQVKQFKFKRGQKLWFIQVKEDKCQGGLQRGKKVCLLENG
jgi:hypothetical protein